ncbi:MAG: hypothetical protein J0H15_02090 [Xanthomonadales bacterium]|nr:hypothetical protein [Xanthomonadales bacterium]
MRWVLLGGLVALAALGWNAALAKPAGVKLDIHRVLSVEGRVVPGESLHVRSELAKNCTSRAIFQSRVRYTPGSAGVELARSCKKPGAVVPDACAERLRSTLARGSGA